MHRLIVDLMPKLKGTMPHRMVPSVLIPLSDLPFLSTSKLDRKTLHRLALPLAVEMSKGQLPHLVKRQKHRRRSFSAICGQRFLEIKISQRVAPTGFSTPGEIL